ncbi:hypothetical protein B296_00025766 [Ensete ventricosum]|uniref:Uncharacterized protein n=1 Tax=Ensete ventricosum TaxID=4639 RepID=A0A427ASE7_ENSVE|nr:hypothetical protein B296_00025766 [Ensete ventricosum]
MQGRWRRWHMRLVEREGKGEWDLQRGATEEVVTLRPAVQLLLVGLSTELAGIMPSWGLCLLRRGTWYEKKTTHEVGVPKGDMSIDLAHRRPYVVYHP